MSKAQPADGNDVDFQASLAVFFSATSKKKQLDEVDMPAAMNEAGLNDFIHVDLWPPSAAVRELATSLKHKSFVFCDLRK